MSETEQISWAELAELLEAADEARARREPHPAIQLWKLTPEQEEVVIHRAMGRVKAKHAARLDEARDA